MSKHEHLYDKLKDEYTKVFVQYNRNNQLARFYFTLFLVRTYPKADYKVITKIADLMSFKTRAERLPGEGKAGEYGSYHTRRQSSPIDLGECRKALNRLIEVKYGVHPPKISEEDQLLYRALDELEKIFNGE